MRKSGNKRYKLCSVNILIVCLQRIMTFFAVHDFFTVKILQWACWIVEVAVLPPAVCRVPREEVRCAVCQLEGLSPPSVWRCYITDSFLQKEEFEGVCQ